MSLNHKQETIDPISRVDAPCLFHGTLGVCVGIFLQLIGMFQKGDGRLMDLLLNRVFSGEAPEVMQLPWLVLLSAVFCYALAFVVLDTYGTWRRVVLGVTVIVLILCMVPTLAVWNIYFSPFLPVVSVFWAWFSTLMYASHHRMPCDVMHGFETNRFKTANAPDVEKEVVVKKEKKTPVDINQKYQPKEDANG